MSKLGDSVLTEKTRVMVTISNFVLLIFTIVSGVVFAVSWKAEIEHRVSNSEYKILIIQEDAKENETLLLETQTSLVEIKTDLKWIRAYMEKDK